MLNFHPIPGTVLLCDYSGFRKPEMVKRRPVIVISPRLRRRSGLCTVVPFSGTVPDPVEAYHCEIFFERPLPKPWGSPSYWCKADMLATVGFRKLDQIRVGHDPAGKHKYLKTKVAAEDLRRIRACVLHALGLGTLTESL
jgi:uncharacterized protein YifN (PemK superfamily)